MAIKLAAYKIGNDIVGIDRVSWDDSELSENDPFILYEETSPGIIPDGYSDITNIENWSKFGQNVLRDYHEVRQAIRLECYKEGWENLSNLEKDIVIDYWANPDQGNGVANTEMVTHLFMTGKVSTQEEASDYLVDKWFNHWEKYVDPCQKRLREAVKSLLHYIYFDDANDIDDDIVELKHLYLNSARIGLNYGDGRDGIMDWVESTNAFYGQGLAENNYPLKKGTIDDLINELRDALVGNRFWDDIALYLQTSP